MKDWSKEAWYPAYLEENRKVDRNILNMIRYWEKGYPKPGESFSANQFLVEKWQVNEEIKRLEELCANSVK